MCDKQLLFFIYYYSLDITVATIIRSYVYNIFIFLQPIMANDVFE